MRLFNYSLWGQNPSMTPSSSKWPLFVLRTENGERYIHTSRQWPAKRRDLVQRVQQALGPLPWDIPPMEPQLLAQVERDQYIEQRVGYMLEIGHIREATLFLPQPLAYRQPAVLCCLGEDNMAYVLARELVAQGFVALVPDEPPEMAPARRLWEHQRGLDFLCHLDAVDSDQLATIGLGKGGRSAILLAAFEHRVKACAAACAYEPFHVTANPALISERYGLTAGHFEWLEVLALIAPRVFHYTFAQKDELFPHAEAIREDMIELGRLYDLLGCREKFSFSEVPNGHGYPPAARREAVALFKSVFQPSES